MYSTCHCQTDLKMNPWCLFLPSGAPLHQQSAQGPHGPWIEDVVGGQGMKGALGGAGERSPESEDEDVPNQEQDH